MDEENSENVRRVQRWEGEKEKHLRSNLKIKAHVELKGTASKKKSDCLTLNAKSEIRILAIIGEWLDITEGDQRRGNGRGNESCHKIKTNPKVKECWTRRRQ